MLSSISRQQREQQVEERNRFLVFKAWCSRSNRFARQTVISQSIHYYLDNGDAQNLTINRLYCDVGYCMV